MASTYTDSLRLVLPATGELDGTWGSTVNTGLTALVDEAIAGLATVVHNDSASYTLTTASGATDEARKMFLNITGTLTAARNVVCPTKAKLYVIKNSTAGGFAVTLKTAAGTGISIPNGSLMVLHCDGTNVVDSVTHLSALTLGTALAVAAGGTGRATGTTANALVATGTTATGAQQSLAVGATTELLVGGGAAALPVWTTATGSGAPVRATSPVLITPNIGTPSAGVVTNLTGTASININGTVGATTPAAGTFTTLSSTGNTTLGDASTDTVTVNGYMGVGIAPATNAGVYVRTTALAQVSQYGVISDPVGTTAGTTSLTGVYGRVGTAASVYTLTDAIGFQATTHAKGAGSTITNATGVLVQDQVNGTNNFGITSLVSSDANKWNIYASGTAQNYFAGSVGIGVATPNLLGVGKALTVLGATTDRGLVELGSTSVTSSGVFGQISAYNGNLTLAGAIQFVGAGATDSGDVRVFTKASGSGITERMRLSSVGNLGLGVTPSAWGTGAAYRAIDIGSGSALVNMASNTHTDLTSNAYYNGTNWIYKNTAVASKYTQGAGGVSVHQWYTAASGTAGNTITFTQSLEVGKGTTLALEGATTAAGTGIAFPATQLVSSNANTLDDYEEGTFVPTIVGTGTAGVGTYSVQVGRYTKIGNKVYVQISLIWSAHTGAGNTQINGLPFTTNATTANNPAFAMYVDTMTVTGQVFGLVNTSNTVVTVQAVNNGTASALALDTAARINCIFDYEV